MSKRVRISNDRLNSYGTRVLTSGMDVEQYRRNPVLLYMHERGNVIGYMKDVRVENGEVTGEPVFDEATELSQRCKRQFEFGSLRMVSAGIDIVELSDSPEHLVPGQRRHTVTKSKLFEVSVVDIGANDDALVLKKDGKSITLGMDGGCLLPELTNNNHPKSRGKMEAKIMAQQLGLPETATDAEIAEKLGELKSASEANAELRKENAALRLASITSLVEKAIGEQRMTADRKAEFIELGKEIGAAKLSSVLSAMSPQVRLSAVLAHGGAVATDVAVTYTKLSEVPGDRLAELREQQPEAYKRLYKAEYGMECEI